MRLSRRRLEESLLTIESDEALTQFADSAREAFVGEVDASIESRHIRRLMLAERSARRAGRRPVVFALRLAAVTALALSMLGGLAMAGVLPQVVEDNLVRAAEKAGFDLPFRGGHDGTESSSGKSVSDDVHRVQQDESLKGRAKGKAISEEASQNRQGPPTSTVTGTVTSTSTPGNSETGKSKKEENKPSTTDSERNQSPR